jgi:hypothetical protein
MVFQCFSCFFTPYRGQKTLSDSSLRWSHVRRDILQDLDTVSIPVGPNLMTLPGSCAMVLQ